MIEPPAIPRARVDWLFVALLAAQIALFWSVRYIPSQDGTSHLANAHVLLKYASPDSTIYHQYYAINKTLEPNLLSHALLVALMAIVPALVAQKILISGYVIALALGARYAIRAVAPKNDFLVVLIFPLAGNLMLQKGFYNFSYSVAIYLWFLGYWLRGRRSPGIVLGLTMLLYLCHPVSLILAISTAGMISIAESHRPIGRRFVEWLAFIPAMALLAHFLIVQTRHAGPIGAAIEPAAFNWKPLQDRLQILASLEVLYSYRAAEAWIAVAYAMLIGITLVAGLLFSPSPGTPGEGRGEGSDERLAMAGDRGDSRTLTLTLSRSTGRGEKRGATLALLLAQFVALFTFFFAPEQAAGGSWIPHRLSLYPWLMLLLILAAGNYGTPARLVIRCVAAVLALGMIASHAIAYHSTQQYLDEYVSAAPHIQRGSTIVSAISDRGGFKKVSPRVRCFLTATGYLDEQRDLVDLYNYEAVMGYFPLVYRPELNPGPYFDDSKDDIPGYVAATHGRVDYVLIWEPSEKYPPTALAMLQPVLDADYQLVYTSPSKFLRLYHHK